MLRELYPNTTKACQIQQLPPSLSELFSDFIQNDLHDNQYLSCLQLRALLHPIQTMILQNSQILKSFSEMLISSRQCVRVITRNSTMARLEELQSLLAKWYSIYLQSQRANPESPFMQTTLILYHLLNLNTITSFAEVERLARKDGFDGTHWDLSLRHRRCIYNSNEAIFHCGQVLRIIKSICEEDRPTWWPMALYRVTLILWVECLVKTDPSFPQHRPSGPVITIDRMQPDDAALSNWRWHSNGNPVLLRDGGGFVETDNPADVLSQCTGWLVERTSTRMADGVRRKLRSLYDVWHGQGTVADSTQC